MVISSYPGGILQLVFVYYHIVSIIVCPVSAFSASTIPSKTSTTTSKVDITSDKAAQVWKTIATAEGVEKDEILTDYKVPDGLRGTYFVNGFGSCRIVKERLVHPFESHGFFKAITFNTDGSIRFRAKYVNTPVRKLEQIFQRPLFRGAMSAVTDMNTPIGNFWNALSPTTRDTANLAVRKWGTTKENTRLIVTCDNAPYYSLDSDTLETNGIETLDTKLLEGKKMLAHTRVDSQRQRMVSVSLDYLPLEQATEVHFYEFDSTGKLVSDRKYKTSPAVIFHDWMLTPNYYIVPAAEAVFDLSKIPDLLLGKSAATGVFALDGNAPAKVLLIPRDPDQEVIESQMSDNTHGVSFHFGPSYETTTDDGLSSIILHLFVFDRYKFGDEMGFRLDEQDFTPTPWSLSNGGPKLQRWTISLNNDDRTTSMRCERLSELKADMPTFHPEKDGLFCRYLYSVCGIRETGFFPFNALCKYDLVAKDKAVEIWPPGAANAVRTNNYEDWDGGPGAYAEPLFVPRRQDGDSTDDVGNEEDDGFLLTTFHDAEAGTTTLEIFDAKKVSDGPIQKIPLGELMGWNVHSSFDPA